MSRKRMGRRGGWWVHSSDVYHLHSLCAVADVGLRLRIVQALATKTYPSAAIIVKVKQCYIRSIRPKIFNVHDANA
eukprot:scaffold30918_cov26-Cyclotella_meneghiniana.AAC.1